MSLWTLIRIVAGLVVVGVVIFTMTMFRHVREAPVGGVFTEWVPVHGHMAVVKALPKPTADSPEIDPGAKVFEKARQLLAVGDLTTARDRLKQVVTVYPRSGAAPEARRILSEMNLDDLLSPSKTDNKKVYKVQRGDSYLAIADRFGTSLDMIVYLNGLYDLKSLQPNDELLLMPMNLKLLIEPDRDAVSVWDGEVFIAEFPAVKIVGLKSNVKTKISSKRGVAGGGKSFPPSSPEYRGSSKVLSLETPAIDLSVAPVVKDGSESDLPPGVYLQPETMEELALMLRPGNEVEIRQSAR